jgi:hypothetical protein
MGAYQIWIIEFNSKEDRDKTEKSKIPGRRLFQFKYLKSYECAYFIGWDGYAAGAEYLNFLKKIKVKPVKFLSLDLSTQSRWYDELKKR